MPASHSGGAPSRAGTGKLLPTIFTPPWNTAWNLGPGVRLSEATAPGISQQIQLSPRNAEAW